MDDSSLEHLVDFLREEIDNVVHLIDSFTVFGVSVAPLWEELFSQKEDQISYIWILGDLHVFGWVENTHLDLVEDGSEHGLDQCLSLSGTDF